MIGAFSAAVINAFRYSLFRCVSALAVRCRTVLFPVVLFLDRGHPFLRKFYSTIPVDIIRVKSYVNGLVDPASVPMGITINKLTSLQSGLCPVLLTRALNRRRSGYGQVGCLAHVL